MKLQRLLDPISVMTYDFHGGWGPCIGHNIFLHVGNKDGGDMCYCNCEYAMKSWIDSGVPSEKLIMCFPTYGRTFRLSTSDTSVCAYSLEQVHLVLTQICIFLNKATNVWTEGQKVLYAYKNTEWFGYDNIESYGYKG
nr:acidic mammalian chitinase-like [Kogia breviceps]